MPTGAPDLFDWRARANSTLFSDRPESEFSLNPARLATNVSITGAHGYTPLYSALHHMNEETPVLKNIVKVARDH